MERIFLSLLFLSAWRSSSSLPRQYIYVADRMTWTEAQTYCRNTYTDLATVDNTGDNLNLYSMVSPWYQSYVWIGLDHKIEWKWSDGSEGGTDNRPWGPYGEPDFNMANQFCGQIGHDGKWYDGYCNEKRPAICYNGTPENPTYFLVSEELDWTSAQSYCRQNYKDLATVKTDAQNQEAKELVPSGKKAWTGLYRDPDFSWSDGAVSTFKNWGNSVNVLGKSAVLCATADMFVGAAWSLQRCDTRYPFVCYIATSEKQVVKLKFKAEGSVDMNDPAVKAQILKQLQHKVKEDGLSGVTLKWREQTDGKVFHKEETCPQKKKNNRNSPLCG